MKNRQIIPFPLPGYLAEFVIHQMDAPLEKLENGIQAKALHISRHSEFGKFILRSLKKSNKPAFIREGCTMYIAASNYSGNNDKNISSGRCSFLDLDDREIREITSVFKSWFNSCLYHWIDGARFAHKQHGRERGMVHKAILAFMDEYNISHDETYFETFRKFYSREKKAQKQPLTRMI